LARAFTEDTNFASARVQFVRLHDQLRSGARGSRHQLGRALNNIGVCYEHLGQLSIAEQYFQKALQESAPDDVVPYHNLALVYFKTGRRNEALRLLKSTKERFPENQPSRLLFSSCCRELGLIDEAVDELRSLVSRPDALQDAFVELGSVLTEIKRDFAGGISVSEEGLLRFPKNPTLVNNLAYAHLMGGDWAAARDVLNRFPRSKWPRGTQVEVVLTATFGLLRLYEGKFEEGEDLYSEATRHAASLGDRNLYRRVQQKKCLELGRAHLRSGQYEAALRQARLGLKVREGLPSYTEDLEALVAQVQNLRAQGSLF
jgi:tetratricopeptide (TPR) repeat protein